MGGLATEAAGGDFKIGALAAGANEALIDSLAKQYGSMDTDKRSGLLVMNSQVLGVLVASIAGGDEKDMQIGASVAGNATKYNRQLHPSERELAERMAKDSDGRFTVEQIEEQLRLSKITGTEITAGSDMLVDGQDGKYDTGGDWVQLSDGRSLQRISMADKDVDVINYISEQIGIYDWTLPRPVGSNTDGSPDWQRDKLTGYSLDSEGGYRVPMTIDGKVYSPRFHTCGTAECIKLGANIDMTNPGTLKWIQAADVNALDNASTALSFGAVFTPAGPAAALSIMSTVSSLFSGYLSDESYKAGSVELLSAGFKTYAVKHGVDPVVADRLTNALDATGFFKNAVNAHWESGDD